ncbi:MAG: histidine kinase [Phycisphaerae bacterium]|nr:histidine kinase [Gemmatimonadaceae bacterium]
MTTTVGLTLNRNPSEPELSLVPIFISQLLVWWYWAALTPAVWWLGRTFPVERQRLAFSLPIHAACAMAAGLFYAISSALIMRLSFPETAGTEPLLQWIRNYLTTRLPVGVLLYFALLGIGAALDSRLRLRQRDLHAARLSEQLAQAQVQALQTQLQPHFLFNTLHAIGMLVHEDPPAAGRMLTRLGDLLRQTLALTDVPEIPLRQELSILDDYLGIERVRFGDRLSVELEIDQSLLSAAVPTFVMQPLVENAVRFGVTSRVGPGRVRIIAKPVGSGMQLVVQDDGPETNGEQKSAELLGHMPGATSLDEATPGMMPIGVSASTHSEARNGIGLSSIKARLAALYPHEEQASLALIKLPNGGTSAVLSLPRRDIHA